MCERNRIQASDLNLVGGRHVAPPSQLEPNVDRAPPPGTTGTGATRHRYGRRYNCRPDVSLEDFLEKIERKVITEALETTRWNKTAAAKNLGITFRALRYRLKKLGLE